MGWWVVYIWLYHRYQQFNLVLKKNLAIDIKSRHQTIKFSPSDIQVKPIQIKSTSINHQNGRRLFLRTFHYLPSITSQANNYQIAGVFQSIGACLRGIVNAIGSVIMAIVNGVVSLCDIIITCLTCGYCGRRKGTRTTRRSRI